MNYLEWFKPGIRIKRWIVMGLLGLSVFVLGVSKLLFRVRLDVYSILYIYLAFLGILLIYEAVRLCIKSMLILMTGGSENSPINKQMIGDLLYEQRLLMRGPRIVVIGGGTGLSTMLRGLKEYTSNISAIVTVADDGGGSGTLREELGMLPPGDIRNCLVALAHTEPVMEELMQYRFTDGNLKGQSFGNLFIAAMNGISVSFEEAIKKMSDVLAVKGRVYPVTLEDVTLCAELEGGEIVKGESMIPHVSSEKGERIKRIFLEPEAPKPLEDALYALENADCIVMGPGSLYTSVLPNLVIEEITRKVKASDAIKIYVCNMMTQPGETDGFKLSDHVRVIEEHCGKNVIDFVIANDGAIPLLNLKQYNDDGQIIVELDKENLDSHVKVISENLVHIRGGLLRHNTGKLAVEIMRLILKHKLLKHRRLVDHYYLSERIKNKSKELK